MRTRNSKSSILQKLQTLYKKNINTYQRIISSKEQLSLIHLLIFINQYQSTIMSVQQFHNNNLIPHLYASSQHFNLTQILLTLCKPNTSQIDFLTLPQTLQQINSFHQKTCQQIVQFVDAHCQQYLQINNKFQLLQQSVVKVQQIVKQVGIKLSDYAKVYYSNEGKVQQLITNYELSILQHVLLTYSRQCTMFLSEFVSGFEHIATKPITLLSFNERHMLIKYCHNFSTLSTILNHHIVQQSIPQTSKIQQLMVNLVDEVEFYLSQQLQRVVSMGVSKSTHTNNNSNTIMNQIKLCYTYLNKHQQYYRLIQQHLISLQIQSAQRNLISQKINLIGGKSVQVVEEYFKAIFNIFIHLPIRYPLQRVLEVIFGLLKKTQIKFLYTYTLPIFPVSYNCYIKKVQEIDNNTNQLDTQTGQKSNSLRELKQRLRRNHNWDLRRWVDVREKNVIDRCGKDWEKCLEIKQNINNVNINSNNDINGQISALNTTTNSTKPLNKIRSTHAVPDLLKWLQIIFKQNCKILGVKNSIVSLAIKVINKYSLVIQKSLTQIYSLLQPQYINTYIKTYNNIQSVIRQKLMFFYDHQLKQNKTNAIDGKQQSQLILLINKIAASCKQSLYKSIQKVIVLNTKLLSKSCCGCLQPYKQFIMKIIKSHIKQPSASIKQPINMSKKQQHINMSNKQHNSISNKQHNSMSNKCINSQQVIQKPLHSYLQNTNNKLSSQSKLWIRNTVTQQVMKYYDQHYVTQIYQYARVNLSVQQLAQVMSVVGNQRTLLFTTKQQSQNQQM